IHQSLPVQCRTSNVQCPFCETDARLWTFDIGLSKLQRTSRYHDRWPTDAHLFNFAGPTLHFQFDAARTLDEITLFNDEPIDTFNRIDSRRIVRDQGPAQRSGGASGRGIFANVHAYEKACMRARFADFDRFASESVATGTTTKNVAAFDYLVKQILINAAITEIGQRSDRHQKHCVAGRHRLNRQSLVQILAGQSERARNFSLLVTVVNLATNLELALCHHHAHRLAVFEFDVHRQDTDSDFMFYMTPSVAIFRKWHDALARKAIPRAGNRMARKRQLNRRCEDAQSTERTFFLRRQHKNRF